MIGQGSVTFQVRGGIGNQLFMYAMARRLALANKVPLYLETESGFDGDFFRRNYGLDRFRIVGEEVRRAKRSQLRRKAEIAANEVLPFRLRWFLREADAGPNAAFDERLLRFRFSRPVFVEGYWQDRRYFADIEAELRDELTFSTPPTQANEKLAEQMRSTESVAVHIRQLHGVPAGVDKPSAKISSLPVAYYRDAMDRIRELVPRPRFYLFSDSPSHAVPFRDDDAVQVVNEGEDAQYEDLWLMSQCRHFVLANSTFSWWGTWMGRTANSVIVSPVMGEWGQQVRVPALWQAIEWRREGGLEQRQTGWLEEDESGRPAQWWAASKHDRTIGTS
jgi:hypothetical protein